MRGKEAGMRGRIEEEEEEAGVEECGWTWFRSEKYWFIVNEGERGLVEC